ncbi:hypothetical protein Y600_6162 [Burkholderia pseudomallei MSHR3709]|nr:hypothetical protein Y600_6162 [Burkholderia pseudomallei MSHR3709]
MRRPMPVPDRGRLWSLAVLMRDSANAAPESVRRRCDRTLHLNGASGWAVVRPVSPDRSALCLGMLTKRSGSSGPVARPRFVDCASVWRNLFICRR